MKIKNNILTVVLCGALAFSVCGCVYLVVGTVGALGGYIVSPDTVEGITGNDKDALWDAAIDVISIMGLVEDKQKSSGIILAKVNNAKVTITISPLSQSTIKLSVKARKSFLPKISIAQDVFVKIMSQVNE